MNTGAAKLAEVAQSLNAAHPAGGKLPALFFFTDEARLPDPRPAIAALPEGCGVIFRHYKFAARAALAQRVVGACHDQGRICLIAGDERLATETDSDGLHLPEHMLRERKTVAPPEWITTAAAHTAEALDRAGQVGVRAAFLSPVFETESHPEADVLGVARFTELVRATSLPVYALGGITNETAPRLIGSGAAGIGAIGGLLG